MGIHAPFSPLSYFHPILFVLLGKCTDTTWMGISGVAGADGIIIGQAAFGTIQTVPGTPQQAAFSSFSWNATLGFAQDVSTTVLYNATRGS